MREGGKSIVWPQQVFILSGQHPHSTTKEGCRMGGRVVKAGQQLSALTKNGGAGDGLALRTYHHPPGQSSLEPKPAVDESL